MILFEKLEAAMINRTITRWTQILNICGLFLIFAQAYEKAVISAKHFDAVPEFFVDGAPKGHRVVEGIRSSKKLLERLKES